MSDKYIGNSSSGKKVFDFSLSFFQPQQLRFWIKNMLARKAKSGKKGETGKKVGPNVCLGQLRREKNRGIRGFFLQIAGKPTILVINS